MTAYVEHGCHPAYYHPVKRKKKHLEETKWK